MIPYIHIPDIKIGPIPLHPFGILVATAVIVGNAISRKRAMRLGYDIPSLDSFITWVLVFGFAGGHIFDTIFYHPEEIIRRPWSLLMLWEGLSSFGGFLGALIGAVMWKYFVLKDVLDLRLFKLAWFKRRPQPEPLLPFCDLLVAVFPVAWIFGRLGCTVVHDHPGAATSANSFLAVAYPLYEGEGTKSVYGPIELIQGSSPRYDLGLIELLFTIVFSALLVLTWKRRWPVGTYIVIVSLVYAPARFMMDFLRITDGPTADLRYAGLTFAQWSCVALFGLGIGVWIKIARNAKQTAIATKSPA